MTKYISFDTWFGGLQNIRTSYELAACLSFLTGRVLILPEKTFCDHLSISEDKKTFFNFWDLYDKDSFVSEFNCIDYAEIKEYDKYNTEQQYFDGICNDIKCFPLSVSHVNWGVNKDVLSHTFTYDELNVEDKFIHFPRNLFGHWYSIISMTEEQKTAFKHKLKRGLKIKEEYNIRFIKQPYNAVHIRGGDFLQSRKHSTDIIFKDINNSIVKTIDNDKPLFIATDVKEKSIFNCLVDYEYYFISDFIESDAVSNIAYDILMCSNAELFYGTKYSTFTDYINIVRKYNNKKDCSKVGLNYDYRHIENKKENYNWHTLFVENY